VEAFPFQQRQRVRFGETDMQDMSAEVRVDEIRHSSWAFEYAVDRADGLHCAEMTTVQVMIDRATLRAAPAR